MQHTNNNVYEANTYTAMSKKEMVVVERDLKCAEVRNWMQMKCWNTLLYVYSTIFRRQREKPHAPVALLHLFYATHFLRANTYIFISR